MERKHIDIQWVNIKTGPWIHTVPAKPFTFLTANHVSFAIVERNYYLDTKGNKGVVLAVHSFSIQPVATAAGGEGLFKVTYTIGTSETGEIRTANMTCKPPADSSANDEFCAINQFEMIVRTNGQ